MKALSAEVSVEWRPLSLDRCVEGNPLSFDRCVEGRPLSFDRCVSKSTSIGFVRGEAECIGVLVT